MRDDRVLGTFLVVVGVLGVVAAVTTALAAGLIVDSFDDDVTASNEVVVEAVDAAQESVEVFGSLVSTVRSRSELVSSTLRDGADTVERTRSALDSGAALMQNELAGALQSLTDLLPAVETAAASVDDALEALDALPIGPDYDPDVPLDEAVASLSGDIDGLAEGVRSVGAQIDDANESLAGSPEQLREVAAVIEELDQELIATDELVERYETSLRGARETAVGALDTIERNSDRTAALIIALSVVFALGQAGQIWLGLRLRRTPTG